ncbi:hypothetical protein AU210_014461 [Fusarium oxysporum f. sp. radicis-cucumerinum]|uniref:lytic cellulose monooxygenase (C4-dehydrogenating) n=2 Tax=Fusarium oxysporum TaxID=5507 RepID=A0A2H3GF54_FUSOX|nr:hypothetical protein FOZG_15908 [Fusarium oxysporum Fo47]PCD25354.1 hypothetical protein AU210_014461 [Fusarium oxysporum f. sp. radicis-cucumerinum]
MLSTTVLLATLSALFTSEVSAHGHVSEVLINDKSYYGHDPTKVPYGPQPESISWTNGAKDNGFVISTTGALSSPDIICHLTATNGHLTADVTAGATIKVRWSDWPEAHWGPVLDYMARCPNDDCTTVDKTKLKFFKIDEMGQLTRGTVPAPGSYVLRHEVIALHAGGAEGTTQMYPQCINLFIKGYGTAQPDGVFATDLYSSIDPGLLHNAFVDEWSDVEYIIPGPSVVKS